MCSDQRILKIYIVNRKCTFVYTDIVMVYKAGVIYIEKPAELSFPYGIHLGLVRPVTAVPCHCRNVQPVTSWRKPLVPCITSLQLTFF